MHGKYLTLGTGLVVCLLIGAAFVLGRALAPAVDRPVAAETGTQAGNAVPTPAGVPVQSGPPPPGPASPVAPAELPSVTPRDTVRMALDDALLVAAARDPYVPVEYVRYLSLHNWPSAERAKLKRLVDFGINSLSTKRLIVRTAALQGNVPDPFLVRVNLLDYNISPAFWDKLFDQGSGSVPIPEPYYHVSLKRQKAGKAHKIQAASPGLLTPQEVQLLLAKRIAEKDTAIGRLVTLTNTRNPIGRADWFVYYALVAPAYYELLGLPVVRGKSVNDPLKAKQADLEKLGNVDLRLARPSLVAGITDTKIVALHNRVLQRYTTVNGYTGGYWWESEDTDTGVDEFDYLNNLAQFDRPKIVAKEIIFTLLNSLQAYGVVNANLELLNLAAANVAQHSDAEPTRLQDKQVYAGRNCVYCHRDGIYAISDKVRSLAQRKVALFISGQVHHGDERARHKQQELSNKIFDAFYPSIENIVRHDQAVYATAIKACNDWSPSENATALELFHWSYYDKPFTLERIAWEVGWAPVKLEAALKTGINLDYTLTGFLQVPPVAPSVLPWERQGFQQLTLFLIGIEAEAARRGVTTDAMLAPYMGKK